MIEKRVDGVDRGGSGLRVAGGRAAGGLRRGLTIGGVLALALVAHGCGGLEDELLEGLRSDENEALCVSPSLLGVDAFETDDGRRYVAKAGEFSFMSTRSAVNALDALREEGYVSRSATSLPRGFGSAFDAFELTSKGAECFQPDAFGASIQVRIGEKIATEIVEYTEPGGGGGPQTLQARFRYRVRLNDLADDLGIEKALKAEVDRSWPGEGEAVYTKTNKGWRLEFAGWN